MEAELRYGCTANLVGTRSPRRAKQSTFALSSGGAELVTVLSGACEVMDQRLRWNWSLKFGRNAEETHTTMHQKLCCESSSALGMTRRGSSTRNTRHIELKSVRLATMERATRSKTRSSGNERDACRLCDEDTVDTNFDSSLETRVGDQIQSRTDSHWDQNDRADEEC